MNVELLKEPILSLAALQDPPVSVFSEKFGDNSIDFELVVWSSEMSYRPRRFRSDLNFAIARQLKEAGIRNPEPAARRLHSQR